MSDAQAQARRPRGTILEAGRTDGLGDRRRLALMLSMTATLLVVVAVNGLGVFWPAPLAEATLADGTKLLGRQITSRTNPDDRVRSIQFKTANREFDPARQDFRWVPDGNIRQVEHPAEVMVLERLENGDFYGFLRS